MSFSRLAGLGSKPTTDSGRAMERLHDGHPADNQPQSFIAQKLAAKLAAGDPMRDTSGDVLTSTVHSASFQNATKNNPDLAHHVQALNKPNPSPAEVNAANNAAKMSGSMWRYRPSGNY